MAKGRPRDPKRAQRGTGHRPKPGQAPKAAKLVSLPTGDDTPAGRRRRFPAPAEFDREMTGMWDVVIAELEHRDLRAGDLEALRQMVTAAYRARQAAEAITKYGVLVMGDRGPIVNPLTKLERDATMTYLRLAEQYGLTLASRLRLGLMQLAGQTVLSALNDDLDG